MLSDAASSANREVPLPQFLQEFGIQFHHEVTPDFSVRLREQIYYAIVATLPYDIFFANGQPDFAKPLRKQQGAVDGEEYSETARGKPCGHVFGKGETVYRCRNCGIDETCVMCQKCYRSSSHEGHDVAMSLNSGSGGCCDCGDPEAWRDDMRCIYHHSDKPPVAIEQVAVPEQVEASLRKTIGNVLDFIIDVMSHAKDSAKPPHEEDDTNPQLDAANSRLTGPRYDESLEMAMEGTWSTVLWNDEKHNFEEVIDIVKRACNKPRNFGREIAALVDSRGRATVFTGNLKESIRIAGFLARIRLGVTVRSTRDIFREDMVEILIDFLKDLASLTITLPDGLQNSDLVRSLVCEEMCKPWLQGVGPVRPQQKDDDDSLPIADSDDDDNDNDNEERVDGDDLEPIDARTLATMGIIEGPLDQLPLEIDEEEQLFTLHRRTGRVYIRTRLQPRPPNFYSDDEDTDADANVFVPEHSENHDVPINPDHWSYNYHRFETTRKTRLTALFLQDLRLWKAARAGLRELYINTMVAIPQFKREMGVRFAIAYKELTEAFLFADREPDQSMILFSVQIFTVPSIAEVLVRNYDFITTLLAVCYTYYSQHKIGHPHEVNTNVKQSSDVYAFRSRRHYHIVNDLRYLLCTNVVQRLIPSMERVHAQFLDWLELFQGQNPQQKATHHHVEYESDSWVSAFNVTMQIAKHAQMFARTFEYANRTDDLDELLSIIMKCCDRLRRWSSGGYRHRRPAFEPREAPHYISFHHPLHWFLAGLVAHLKAGDNLDFLTLMVPYAELIKIAQFPLRVIHITWSIRCNLWVRNGQSIRAQLHHYTDVDSRENCIDKDIQFVQMLLACSSVTPGASASLPQTDSNSFAMRTETAMQQDHAMKAILSTFDSVPPANCMENDANLIHMQDHMMHFLITLYCERDWLRKPSNEVSIARALRHGLIFGPKTYSEIRKMVSDDRGDEACFDKVLKQLTVFYPPVGLEDVGRYQLKVDEYDLVDPYFYHYTLQEVEQAGEILNNLGNGREPVVTRDLYSLEGTAWGGIRDFVYSAPLQEYLITYFTVLRASAENQPATVTNRESVTDKILHLLLLALQEELHRRVQDFKDSQNFVFECGVYFTQTAILRDPNMNPHKAKLEMIMLLLAQLSGELPTSTQSSPRSPNKRHLPVDDQDSEFARKKAIAKARQEKLMSEMKASQDAFLESNQPEISDGCDLEDVDMTPDDDFHWKFPTGNCIICQNATGLAGERETWGVLGAFHESKLERPMPVNAQFLPGMLDVIRHPLELDQHSDWASENQQQYSMKDVRSRSSITTCGHIMHWNCYEQFYASITVEHLNLAGQGRNMPFMVEFQCPLCNTVGNVLLSILSDVQVLEPVTSLKSELDYDDFVTRIPDHCPWTTDLQDAADRLARGQEVNCFFAHRVDILEDYIASGIESHDVPRLVDTVEEFENEGVFGDFKDVSIQCWKNWAGFSNMRDPEANSPSRYAQGVTMLTNSIADIEIALRDRTHNNNNTQAVNFLVDGLSDQNIISLRVQANLIRGQLGLSLYGHIIDLWDDLFDYCPNYSERLDWLATQLSWKHFSEHEDDDGHFFDNDMFGVCVEMALSYVTLDNVRNVANLLLEAEIVKAVMTYCVEFASNAAQLETVEYELDLLSREDLLLFRDWLSVLLPQKYLPSADVVCSVIWRVVQHHALIFVRRFAIFANTVHGLTMPANIPLSGGDELTKLTNVFGLRSFRDVMTFSDSENSRSRQSLQKYWIVRAFEVPIYDWHRPSWPLPVTLTTLPKSLDVLFERCVDFICPKCNTNPAQPALCLFCGTMLCFQSQCCWDDDLEAGECTAHRKECGGSLGLYLIIKRSALLVMRNMGGAFGPAPYLDMHGEMDPDLRRGRPQFLNEKRYEAGVRQLYLQHQIPTWLARRLETSADMGGWETL